VGGDLGRIIPRIELEQMLESLKPHPEPDPNLEQYTTPANVTAEILFTAAHIYDDIVDKLVIDLGCGTGRLGIGALLLGASRAVGIDIDPKAIEVSKENSEAAGVSDLCHWLSGDIALIFGNFDTVLMNPPFGTKRRHLDIKFLSTALMLANTVYSIHKRSTRRFIESFVRRRGGIVSTILQMELEIPWMFNFHKKPRTLVKVDLYRILIEQP
jgi:putative methylase